MIAPMEQQKPKETHRLSDDERHQLSEFVRKQIFAGMPDSTIVHLVSKKWSCDVSTTYRRIKAVRQSIGVAYCQSMRAEEHNRLAGLAIQRLMLIFRTAMERGKEGVALQAHTKLTELQGLIKVGGGINLNVGLGVQVSQPGLPDPKHHAASVVANLEHHNIEVPGDLRSIIEAEAVVDKNE